MPAKSLQLPNGHWTSSDQIRHVKVFPERSPSFECVFMEIYEDDGLVYAGLLDLGRVAATEDGREQLLYGLLADGGFIPMSLP